MELSTNDQQIISLKLFLESVPTGMLDEETTGEIIDLLPWHAFQLDRHNDGGMTAEKLYRAETLEWNAPILSFIIERHGAMVVGSSTRGEKQYWALNLDTLTKTFSSAGHRQILPKQQPVKVAPIAKRYAELMVNSKEDNALKYIRSKCGQVTQVRIITSAVPELATASITGTRIAKQTVTQRRKKFRDALIAILSPLGWSHPAVNTFEPPFTS